MAVQDWRLDRDTYAGDLGAGKGLEQGKLCLGVLVWLGGVKGTHSAGAGLGAGWGKGRADLGRTLLGRGKLGLGSLSATGYS